jgi:cellulose biosynthesis protein BcsQ
MTKPTLRNSQSLAEVCVSDAESPVSPGKDVRALFDKAKIGESRYRTFAPQKGATPAAQSVSAAGREEPRSTASVSGGSQPRPALNALFGANAGFRIAAARAETTATQRAALLFASAAGGVGKTTLCATIARMFSSRVSNVLVADRCVDGILPYYFSAERLRAGGLHVVHPNARRPGYPMTLINVPCHEPLNPSTAAWLDQLQKEMPFSLFDFPVSNGRSLKNYAIPGGLMVIPLTPDVQSVATLAACEELFGAAGDGQASRTLFVLNRFDEKRSLHREIRSHLEKALAERLAPVALRESEAVADALALGMTVIDHAPQSPLSQDFEQLVSWLDVRVANTSEKVEIA